MQQDFILQNFCSVEQFRQFFTSFKETVQNLALQSNIAMSQINVADAYNRFENQLQLSLREEGRANFEGILELLL